MRYGLWRASEWDGMGFAAYELDAFLGRFCGFSIWAFTAYGLEYFSWGFACLDMGGIGMDGRAIAAYGLEYLPLEFGCLDMGTVMG